MRRSTFSTRGFHAPRSSSGHDVPTAPRQVPIVASTAHGGAQRAKAVGVSTAALSHHAPPKAASRSTTIAPITTSSASSGPTTSCDGQALQVPRSALSGHWNANRLRRGLGSREGPSPLAPLPHLKVVSPHHMEPDTFRQEPATRSPSVPAIGHVGEDGATSLSRKRKRSPSSEDCAHSTPYRISGDDGGWCGLSPREQEKDGRPSTAGLLAPLLPMERRLASSPRLPNTVRTVCYSPAAALPVAFPRGTLDFEGGHAATEHPETPLSPAHGVSPASQGGRTAMVVAWGPLTAATTTTTTTSADAARGTAGSSANCGDRVGGDDLQSPEQRSSFVFRTPPPAMATPSPSSTASALSGTQFLSALAHQRNGGTAMLPDGSSPYTSDIPSDNACVSSRPFCTPPGAFNGSGAAMTPLIPGSSADNASAPDVPRASPMRSADPCGAVPFLAAPAGSQGDMNDGLPVAAVGAPSSLVASVRAAATPSSSPQRAITSLPVLDVVTSPLLPTVAPGCEAVAAAVEEESDEVLEREVAEDMRLSTDAAFTPSGTGSAAPPVFSQTSAMHDADEEEQDGVDDVPRQRRTEDEEKEDGGSLWRFSGGGAVLANPTMGRAEPPQWPVASPQPEMRGMPLRASTPISGAMAFPSDPPSPTRGRLECPAGPPIEGNAAGLSAETQDGLTDPTRSSMTWPIRAATPPHLPSASAPQKVVRPVLGILTAAGAAPTDGVAVDARGGRHRTVFTFTAAHAGTTATVATAGPLLGDSLEDPRPMSAVAGRWECETSPARPDASALAAEGLDALLPSSEASVSLGDGLWTPQRTAATARDTVAWASATPPATSSLSSDARMDAPGTGDSSSLEVSRQAKRPWQPMPHRFCPAVSLSSEVASPTGDMHDTPQTTSVLFGKTGPSIGVSTVPGREVVNSCGATTSPARSTRTCFTFWSNRPLSAEPLRTDLVPVSPSSITVQMRADSIPGSHEARSSSVARLSPRGTTTPEPSEVATVAAAALTHQKEGQALQEPVIFAKEWPLSLREEDSNSWWLLPVRSSSKAEGKACGDAGASEWSSSAHVPLLAAPASGDGLEGRHRSASAAPPVVSDGDAMRSKDASLLAGHQVIREVPADAVLVENAATSATPQSHLELHRPSTPTVPPLPPPTAEDDDKFYDLPCDVRRFYATQRGVTSLYDWQHTLLTRSDVRQGRSFIYSLPTSGGKTLVAELSLLRCVLNRRQSCFFVLPFVSLAEEKTAALQPLTAAFDFTVDGHYGSSGRLPLCPAPAIYVCTIEKANALVNHMMEEGRTDEIGAAVVDELHMVGESRRGATLELFLSKLLMIDAARRRRCAVPSISSDAGRLCDDDGSPGRPPCALCKEAVDFGDEEEAWVEEKTRRDRDAAVPLPPKFSPGLVQIIGMSATVPNLHTIADWLGAVCFENDFRPVPLRTYSVVDGLVLRDGQYHERCLSGNSIHQHLMELATEMPEASVLIFCASRQQCVDTAKGIVQYLKMQAVTGQSLPSLPVLQGSDSGPAATSLSTAAASGCWGASPSAKGSENAVATAATTTAPAAAGVAAASWQASAATKRLLVDLAALAHYEASQLSEVVPAGVAFHHGGLLAEERELIEAAFRRKHIRVLCCTSTLAAGVNLPARRVIIKTPYVGRTFLTKSRYLQMCGRAGRAGLDPYGESFLLLTRRDQARGHALLHASVEPCLSQILEDGEALTRSLLECVGVGLVTDRQSADEWSASLLSCRAVGPVDAVWRPHITASVATVDNGEGNASDREGTPNALVTLPGERLSTATAAGHSEGSCLAAGQVAAPASSGSPLLTLVPRAAMQAMVRSALVTLVRCGLVSTTEGWVDKALPNRTVESSGLRDFASHDTPGGLSTGKFPEYESASRAARPADDGAEDPGGGKPVIRVTPFGNSSVRSCFSVEEALLLRAELEELRHNGLILSDDLHLCYFLTPLREVGECDWALLRLMMCRMSDSRQRIASLLGVDAYFIDQQAMGLGGPLLVSDEGRRRLFTAKRFYVALMLADLLAEVPMATVEKQYNVNRGQLQNLMRSASMFSSSITNFCHAMEWFSLEAVLSSFVKRLGFGVKPDLLPLMEIRGMQPPRARALWNAGFKTLATIASADADEMLSKVKSMNPSDNKSAKFFTSRSARMIIREANLALQSRIQEKRGELQELTVHRSSHDSNGVGGARLM